MKNDKSIFWVANCNGTWSPLTKKGEPIEAGTIDQFPKYGRVVALRLDNRRIKYRNYFIRKIKKELARKARDSNVEDPNW